MLFGYVRVSTKSQNPNLQIDALLREGVQERKIYGEVFSGATKKSHNLGPYDR